MAFAPCVLCCDIQILFVQLALPAAIFHRRTVQAGAARLAMWELLEVTHAIECAVLAFVPRRIFADLARRSR